MKEHDGITQKESSSSKLWQKVRFGNGQVQELAQLRTKISYYVSALTLFMNMVSTGTMGRVEKKMDDAGGDLTEIRIAVNGITAHLMAKGQQKGSVFTTYADDDKAVCREFRRELNQEGFSSSVIHDHKKIIKAYIKELASRGVLDDIDEPSGADMEPMPTVSESDELSARSTKTEVNIIPAPNTTMESDGNISRPPSVASRRPGTMRASRKSKGSKLTIPDVKSNPQNTVHSGKSYNSRISIPTSQRPAMRRAETTSKRPEPRKPDAESNSEDSFDSTSRPRHPAMRRAETMPKGSEMGVVDVESKPQQAFVETGSSDSGVDIGQVNAVNSNSSRDSSTDGDNDVNVRGYGSKDEPPQVKISNSVNSEDLDEGLRLLSTGYNGRDFEKPPDSSECRIRCRSCYSRLRNGFLILNCSHRWCYDCLEALVVPYSYPGGKGISVSPFGLAHQKARRSRWYLSASDLSICNWQAMRLECCRAGSLEPSYIDKVLYLELKTGCEDTEGQITIERLQFCPKQGCRAWIIDVSRLDSTDDAIGIRDLKCPTCSTVVIRKEIPVPRVVDSDYRNGP